MCLRIRRHLIQKIFNKRRGEEKLTTILAITKKVWSWDQGWFFSISDLRGVWTDVRGWSFGVAEKEVSSTEKSDVGTLDPVSKRFSITFTNRRIWGWIQDNDIIRKEFVFYRVMRLKIKRTFIRSNWISGINFEILQTDFVFLYYSKYTSIRKTFSFGFKKNLSILICMSSLQV